MESINKYGCAVHTVQKLNQFLDTINLVTVLRHDATALQNKSLTEKPGEIFFLVFTFVD